MRKHQAPSPPSYLPRGLGPCAWPAPPVGIWIRYPERRGEGRGPGSDAGPVADWQGTLEDVTPSLGRFLSVDLAGMRSATPCLAQEVLRSGLRDWEAGVGPRGTSREGRAYTQGRGAGRQGGLGHSGSRVSGGVESPESEGPNPMAVWTKRWLRCCSNGTLGTQSKRQKLSFLRKSQGVLCPGQSPKSRRLSSCLVWSKR